MRRGDRDTGARRKAPTLESEPAPATRRVVTFSLVSYDSLGELQRAAKQCGLPLASAGGGFVLLNRAPPEVHVRRIYGEHDREAMYALGHELWHVLGGRH